MQFLTGVLSIVYVKNRLRRIRRRLAGCCLLVAMGLLLACGLLFGLSFYLARLAGAQETQDVPLTVLLLIDNSNSMYEMGGTGSDPNLLRIEAARLFITYLGVDSHGPAHRLGVIFFGGQAQLIAPITALTDDAKRAELARLIANPTRLTWTDPQAALELAEKTFAAASGLTTRRAMVLLTDGKPEWSTAPTAAEKTAINARLRDTAGRFAAAGISLFIILLQNAATDADPEIAQVYVPLWQEMAASTPPGRFYQARSSRDLLDIYHDIVVTLTGRQTAGVVVQTEVQTETLKQISIEPGLAQVTFVVRKSEPALQVTLLRPNGRSVSSGQPGVQYAGQPGQSAEEIWAITGPQPGLWQVRLNGQGSVTVWKDFYPAPPTPTFTPSPTASSTPSPTITPSPPPMPVATFTSVPTPVPPPSPTPTPLPAITPTPAPPSLITPASLACWLGLPLLGLIAGASWLWARQRRAEPLLEGTLLPLVSLPAEDSQAISARIDLDGLRRKEVKVGSGPQADVILPQLAGPPQPTVRFAARRGPDGEVGVVLIVPASETEAERVQVNNLPVSREWPLQDGDVLALGAYRFRYDNLRQRVKRMGEWRPGE